MKVKYLKGGGRGKLCSRQSRVLVRVRGECMGGVERGGARCGRYRICDMYERKGSWLYHRK